LERKAGISLIHLIRKERKKKGKGGDQDLWGYEKREAAQHTTVLCNMRDEKSKRGKSNRSFVSRVDQEGIWRG